MTGKKAHLNIYILCASSATAAVVAVVEGAGPFGWGSLLLLAGCQLGILRHVRASTRNTKRLEDESAALAGELRRANDELRLARAVFETVQEGVVVTDLDANIVAANAAFRKITEYSDAELKGRNMRLLSSGRQDPGFYSDMWSSLRSTGRWQGEIWDRRKGGEIYPQWLAITTVHDVSGMPAYYIGVVADVSRMRHAQSHLQYLAQHDSLTGLPNRALLGVRFAHTLERMHRNGTRCALLYMDLDGFKKVNDHRGHAAGDQVLKTVAARMRERLRETDTLARVGGDEFVLVLEQICGRADAEMFAHRLIERLRYPINLADGTQVTVGVSIGISLFPDDGADPDSLMGKADAALYAAKNSGRGTWCFHGDEAGRDGGQGAGSMRTFGRTLRR